MIRFACEHCGVRLSVPETRAGREGRCPKCKGAVTVPAAAGEPLLAPNAAPTAAAPAQTLDPQLLDLSKAPSTERRSVEEQMRELEARVKLGLLPAPEHSGERQFAWPIDILLYPANAAGLTAMTILVGIPVLLGVVERLFGLPGLVLFPISILFGLYGSWYFMECVQDSAQGGTRTPDRSDAIVGPRETWSRVSNLVAVHLAFVAPAGFYHLYAQRTDAIFWVLVAWGVLFLPIGLLAVIIEESLAALNPLFLLRSILQVLRPYLGLLALFAAPAALAWLLARDAPDQPPAIWLQVTLEIASGYGGFVLAHLLGRFYWRHADRLDWDF